MVVQQPIESHAAHSERSLQHAEEQVTGGDRLQASEKAWGAVAHHLKGTAEQRGWSYRTHADVFRIVDRLSREMREPRLKTLFAVANGLHQNFYEDAMELDYVRSEIEDVKELLAILGRADR